MTSTSIALLYLLVWTVRSTAVQGTDVCTQGTFWGCWNLKQLTAFASISFLALRLTLHTIHLPHLC